MARGTRLTIALAKWVSALQCVAVYCSVLQHIAMCCSVLQSPSQGLESLSIAPPVGCVSVLQRGVVCCSVLQHVAACCSVLQFSSRGLESREKHASPSHLPHVPLGRALYRALCKGAFKQNSIAKKGLYL